MTTTTPSVLHFPGPRHPDRRQAVTTHSATVHTALRSGIGLLDALAEVVDRYGSDCAQIELMGGTFDRISYCVPACGVDPQPVSYSETREAAVPAQLLTASITFGYRHAQRFMHCHALWLDADGELRAGHLWPDSVTGAVAPYAVLHTLPGVVMVSEDDRETRMPAFTPKPGDVGAPTAAQADHRRAVICRIRSGEDILDAVEKVCLSSGITHGVIRASVGSLVGARLLRRQHDTLVDGPATEIISLAGTVRPATDGSTRAQASAVVVDRHGQVHAGQLVRGHNPVAVTFELFIIEEGTNL